MTRLVTRGRFTHEYVKGCTDLRASTDCAPRSISFERLLENLGGAVGVAADGLLEQVGHGVRLTDKQRDYWRIKLPPKLPPDQSGSNRDKAGRAHRAAASQVGRAHPNRAVRFCAKAAPSPMAR